MIEKYQKKVDGHRQEINFQEFNKKYKLILSNSNNKKQNLYYIYDNNTIALIVSMDSIHYYLSLIDYKSFKLVKNIFWNLHFPDKRHPKHNLYLEKYILFKKFRIQNYIYFNGNIEKMINNKLIIDHLNRNSLDNRKNNLRLVSIIENNRNQITRSNNTSGITGVRFDKQKNIWISVRTLYFNGRFENPKARSIKSSFFKDAILARKKLELIDDKDFLSSIPTLKLFEKYEKEGKFDNLIKEFAFSPA